jgi:hypothetical protein
VEIGLDAVSFVRRSEQISLVLNSRCKLEKVDLGTYSLSTVLPT